MGMSEGRLAQLKALTDADWQVKSRALQVKASEERQIQSDLAALKGDRRALQENLRTIESCDSGQLIASAQWMRWAERERNRLNRKLAKVRAEMAQQRQVAARSFGRDQALGELIKRMKQERKRADSSYNKY